MPRPFARLLRELNSLPGDFWIRLLYTHPAHWTDELIQTIAECPKVARYVDIPLQHIHENMLERMRRETSQQYIVDLIKKSAPAFPASRCGQRSSSAFRAKPRRVLRTLLDFIRETKFERLGVFTYSKEDGTLAGKMAGQISDKMKQTRRELAMAAQHKIARQVSESFVGREIKVLIEGRANEKQLRRPMSVHGNTASFAKPKLKTQNSRRKAEKTTSIGLRGEADAPDIDGRIYMCAANCRSANSPASKSSATRIMICLPSRFDRINKMNRI
jgi:tRNA A37 methylthiotransferase MiaB